MTIRERWNRVFHWQKPGRVPDMEFGYWDDALNTYRNLLKIKPDEDMDLMVTALADIFK